VWAPGVLPSALPAAPASRTFVRALQRRAFALDVVISGTATRTVRKGLQHQQALHLLRAGGAMHRADCERPQCYHPRVRKSLMHQQVVRLLPALLCPAIASDVVTYSAAIRPAAPAGRTLLTCGAVPCRRAGRGHLQCCRQRVRNGQQHQLAVHLLRAVQRHAIGPDAGTYGAATSVTNKCQRHLQASHLLRARRRHAIAPTVIACCTAISVCVMSQQHRQALHPLRAMLCQPSRRTRSPTGPP